MPFKSVLHSQDLWITLQINLEKVQERWWESVFVDEPKINTQEIEASISVGDLDNGAQSAVGKLMYDEQQKRLGLPTSDQQVGAGVCICHEDDPLFPLPSPLCPLPSALNPLPAVVECSIRTLL